MKKLIIISAIIIGIFFPSPSYLLGFLFPSYSYSTKLILIMLIVSLGLGLIFPDMMNANSLSTMDDKEKVSFKSRISILKNNSISLWVGVFVFFAALTSILKSLVIRSEINQIGIVILFFSFGIFIRIIHIHLPEKSLD